VKANLFFTHQKALGTNPFSFGAPAKDGDAFVVDMATTAVAVGKVKVKVNCFIATVQRGEMNSN
jgi:LDH2 family malate/lactate/ureidoglycolate dehydrogenase